MISGCNGSSSDDAADDQVADSGIVFDIASVNYAGITVDETEVDLAPGARLLASQCAQCHGTYGVSVRDWPALWGEERRISKWMNDYQDEEYESSSMHIHALAYTEDEVNLLKTYYPKVTYTEAEGE